MQPTTVTPAARLDRLRATPSHAVWIVVLGLGFLVETFDNSIFSFLAPAIRAEWGLSIGQVGSITSGVFLGMMVGAIISGRLCDRLGRKPVLVGASVFYSFGSLVCALAPGFTTLFVGRVLTGVGVQAGTGAILVYVSEMFPRLSRGRFFSAVVFFGYIGTPITSFSAAAIAPSGPGAWRWGFALGCAGLLIAAAVASMLPETVRWLSLNDRNAEAEAIVGRLEAQDSRRGELAPVQPLPTGARHGSFAELLAPRYRKLLAVVTLAFAGLIFCQFGFLAWMPTMLVGSGLPQPRALYLASIITLGSLAMAPFLFLLADSIERKTALLAESVLTAAAFLIFGYVGTEAGYVAGGFLASMGIGGLVATFYNYIPEVFPTELRGVGTGLVNGIGRVAGVAAGLVGAAMYSGLGTQAMLLVLGVLIVVVGGTIFALGPRTTRRSLETISTEA